MKKAKILIVSTAVVLALSVNANAASPAQNNIEVQKALKAMQEGLQKPKGNLQIVVAPNKPIPVKPINAVVYKPHIIKPQMPQAIINGIIVSPDSVLIQHNGVIYYNITQISKQTIAIDIINPVYDIGTQSYKPENTGNISNAVVAYHLNKNLYGYPYLRIAINLKKQSQYSVGSINSSFAVSFGRFQSVPNMPVVPSNNTQSIQTNVQNNNTQPIQVELLQKINQLENQIALIKKTQQAKATPLPAKDSELYKDFKKAESPIKNAQTIQVSLKNISCINSPYPIKKVIFSKEDSLQLQVVGNQVFVKILPLKILKPDGIYKYKYSDNPRDIYIITDEKTYSLNLVPKNTPAVTYNLAQKITIPTQSVSQLKNLQQDLYKKQLNYAQEQMPQFTSNSAEIQNSYVSELIRDIKEAYIGKTPSGFTLVPFNFEKKYLQLTIKGKYKFIGSDVILYAYKLIANQNLNIDPSQFVWLVSKPMAASIIDTQLKAGHSTMLYIIGGK